MTYKQARRCWRYHYREAGFFRMNILYGTDALRIVLMDTRKHRPLFSDRRYGWRVGWLLVRVGVQRNVVGEFFVM